MPSVSTERTSRPHTSDSTASHSPRCTLLAVMGSLIKKRRKRMRKKKHRKMLKRTRAKRMRGK